MTKFILETHDSPFTWIDITNPSQDDFSAFKDKYNISNSSIKDAVEVGHLPKIEEFKNYHFLIIRSISTRKLENDISLVNLTDRISIFYNESFVITSHRNSIRFLDKVINKVNKDKKPQSSKELVNTLVSASLNSFEEHAINNLTPKLNQYEEIIFLQKERRTSLEKIYYIRRQVDLIRNILTFYKDLVDYFHMPEYKNIYTQDLKDSFHKSHSLYKNLSENTSQLLSIYFNIESNHTNEIMRLLTIISVFFMPLTFLTGVYGMNFDSLPGLHAKHGYIMLITCMIVIAIIIYFLFKRKKWL